MYRLILIRHGESIWNRANRFTGWTDVGLTEKGEKEARDAGNALKERGFNPKVAYTSYLTRAIKTLWLMLEEMDLMYIPEFKSWRLNEKHYGNLQGLNKKETSKKFGDKQVHLWRRSFDTPPPPIEESDERHPKHDPRYSDLTPDELPATESLKDTINRILPYWESAISGSLREHGEVLVAAHGNSLRGIVKHIRKMTDDEILKFEIPTGIPYIFEFNDDFKLLKDYFIGDPGEIRKLQEKVASQSKNKA